MREKYRYLIGNIGLFIIATFIPKVLSFFMIPIYTRCLTTTNYGTADLLTNTVQLVIPILTLQVQDAVMRYALDKTYQRDRVLSVGIKITIWGGIILSAILLTSKMVNIFPLDPVYYAFLIINYFTGSLNNIFSYFCRGIDKIKTLTAGSVLCSFITVGCNLLFLLKFRWGLYGYLGANTIGAFCNMIYIFLCAKLFRYITKVSIRGNTSKNMIFFSVPMIFSALSWWVNNASDKYIVTFFCGVSVTGIYAASYKIPTILTAFGDVIAKAFSISAIRDFDAEDKDGFIGKTYAAISLWMTVGCSVLMLMNIPLAKILFAKNFYSAWMFVPPLLISVLFNQLSLSCENIFIAVKKTKIVSRTAILGAIINIGLNFLLIPFFSAYGAAIATVISFGAVWLFRYRCLKYYISLKNIPKKEFISYILVIFQMLLAYWKAYLIIPQIILFMGILLIYKKEIVKCYNYKKLHA